jgi:ankyrin repeat protein
VAANISGKTPLHCAAEAKSYPCVSILLENCGDTAPELQDDTGRTALHYALRSGEVDCSIDLIWAGASPATPDRDGVTPFHLVRGGCVWLDSHVCPLTATTSRPHGWARSACWQR